MVSYVKETTFIVIDRLHASDYRLTSGSQGRQVLPVQI